MLPRILVPVSQSLKEGWEGSGQDGSHSYSSNSDISLCLAGYPYNPPGEREKLGMEAASDSDCDRLRGFLACTLTTLGKDSSARSEIDRPRSEL